MRSEKEWALIHWLTACHTTRKEQRKNWSTKRKQVRQAIPKLFSIECLPDYCSITHLVHFHSQTLRLQYSAPLNGKRFETAKYHWNASRTGTTARSARPHCTVVEFGGTKNATSISSTPRSRPQAALGAFVHDSPPIRSVTDYKVPSVFATLLARAAPYFIGQLSLQVLR
jgi:hypothetical protein